MRHPAPMVAPGVCYGRLDVDVTPAARARFGDSAGYPAFRGAEVVWTSPAVRCRGLAEAIAGSLGVPLRVDQRLWELDFGAWEGQRWDTIPREALDRWAADLLGFAAPGGESGAALIARLRNFHGELRDDCVVVSHGGPLKVLRALLRGEPPDLLAPPPAIGSVTVC